MQNSFTRNGSPPCVPLALGEIGSTGWFLTEFGCLRSTRITLVPQPGKKRDITSQKVAKLDQLSAFSPDMFSSGHKVVCESNTETYAQAFRVPGSYRDDILNANDGRRFHTFYTHGSFLDFNNGPVIPPLVPKTSQEAKASLLRMLAGDYDMSVW